MIQCLHLYFLPKLSTLHCLQTYYQVFRCFSFRALLLPSSFEDRFGLSVLTLFYYYFYLLFLSTVFWHKSHLSDLHPNTSSYFENRIVRYFTILPVPIRSMKSGFLGLEKQGANTTAQLYSVILVTAWRLITCYLMNDTM